MPEDVVTGLLVDPVPVGPDEVELETETGDTAVPLLVREEEVE